MPRIKSTHQSLRDILNGIAAVFTPGKSMAFRGKLIDGPGLQAVLAPVLSVFDAVDSNKSVYHLSIEQRTAMVSTAEQLVNDVKKGAEMSFGGTPDYEQLGFKPPKKRATRTAEQKQLAAERMKATRKARGVLGKKQRAAIRGVVPTPPATPPANQSQGNGSGGKS